MAKEFRSADELVRRILSDPRTWENIQADHSTELLKLAKAVGDDMPPSAPLESDVTIYRMVVGVIGIVAILGVFGAILMVFLPLFSEKAVEANPLWTALLTALVSISSAAIGALAGLLSPVSFRG